MLLKLIPPSSPTGTPSPTIHFSFSFPEELHLPLSHSPSFSSPGSAPSASASALTNTLRLPPHIPTPSSWTAQMGYLVGEELEVPFGYHDEGYFDEEYEYSPGYPNAYATYHQGGGRGQERRPQAGIHALDKSVGLVCILEEVVFDLDPLGSGYGYAHSGAPSGAPPMGVVRCRFIDGAIVEWPLDLGSGIDATSDACKLLAVLHSVMRDVRLSTAEDERVARELEAERERERVEREAKEGRHQRTKSLLAGSRGPMVMGMGGKGHKKQKSLFMQIGSFFGSIVNLASPTPSSSFSSSRGHGLPSHRFSSSLSLSLSASMSLPVSPTSPDAGSYFQPAHPWSSSSTPASPLFSPQSQSQVEMQFSPAFKPTSTITTTLAPPPSARTLRRAARSALVDAFRRFVVSALRAGPASKRLKFKSIGGTGTGTGGIAGFGYGVVKRDHQHEDEDEDGHDFQLRLEDDMESDNTNTNIDMMSTNADIITDTETWTGTGQPGGYCVWIVHSMRRRAMERMEEILEEEGVRVGVDVFSKSASVSPEAHAHAHTPTHVREREVSFPDTDVEGQRRNALEWSPTFERGLEATTMCVPLSFSDDEPEEDDDHDQDQDPDADVRTIVDVDCNPEDADGRTDTEELELESVSTPTSSSHSHFGFGSMSLRSVSEGSSSTATSVSDHSSSSGCGSGEGNGSVLVDYEPPSPTSPTSPTSPISFASPPSPPSKTSSLPTTPTGSSNTNSNSKSNSKPQSQSQHQPQPQPQTQIQPHSQLSPHAHAEYTHLLRLRQRLFGLALFSASRERNAQDEIRARGEVLGVRSARRGWSGRGRGLEVGRLEVDGKVKVKAKGQRERIEGARGRASKADRVARMYAQAAASASQSQSKPRMQNLQPFSTTPFSSTPTPTSPPPAYAHAHAYSSTYSYAYAYAQPFRSSPLARFSWTAEDLQRERERKVGFSRVWGMGTGMGRDKMLPCVPMLALQDEVLGAVCEDLEEEEDPRSPSCERTTFALEGGADADVEVDADSQPEAELESSGLPLSLYTGFRGPSSLSVPTPVRRSSRRRNHRRSRDLVEVGVEGMIGMGGGVIEVEVEVEDLQAGSAGLEDERRLAVVREDLEAEVVGGSEEVGFGVDANHSEHGYSVQCIRGRPRPRSHHQGMGYMGLHEVQVQFRLDAEASDALVHHHSHHPVDEAAIDHMEAALQLEDPHELDLELGFGFGHEFDFRQPHRMQTLSLLGHACADDEDCGLFGDGEQEPGREFEFDMAAALEMDSIQVDDEGVEIELPMERPKLMPRVRTPLPDPDSPTSPAFMRSPSPSTPTPDAVELAELACNSPSSMTVYRQASSEVDVEVEVKLCVGEYVHGYGIDLKSPTKGHSASTPMQTNAPSTIAPKSKPTNKLIKPKPKSKVKVKPRPAPISVSLPLQIQSQVVPIQVASPPLEPPPGLHPEPPHAQNTGVVADDNEREEFTLAMDLPRKATGEAKMVSLWHIPPEPVRRTMQSRYPSPVAHSAAMALAHGGRPKLGSLFEHDELAPQTTTAAS